MKHLFALTLGIGLLNAAYSQTIRASLGPGSTPNRVKIYLQSDAALTTNISTLQFNLAISSSITPQPTAAVVSNAFAGSTWITEYSTEGGYYNFMIQTPTSPLTLAITTAEFEAMEVEFNGGPAGANDVALVTLPDGGVGAAQGKAIFLCTGTPASNGSSLYYARSGVTVSNGFSYDPSGTPPGTTTSTAIISGISLPVKFLSFIALKSGENVRLTWNVENDGDNKYFEVERSLDGRNFSSHTTINALQNGRSLNTYETDDANISKLGAKLIYYRIKQVDKNGNTTYSLIKSINVNAKGSAVFLYPNPARNHTQLVVNADAGGKASIIVRNAAGKQVLLLNTQLVKGINQQTINTASLIAGEYHITVQGAGLNENIKFSKLN